MNKICLPAKEAGNVIIEELMHRSAVAELIFFLFKLNVGNSAKNFCGTDIREI